MHIEEKSRKSYLETLEKGTCTGCKACQAVCPIGCIEMIEDTHGFLYPKIKSDKCIKCGMCTGVCPYVYDHQGTMLKKAVAAVHKNDDIVFKSSSGGAFYALAQAWEAIHGEIAIFGVCMDENFNVIHKCVYGTENIGLLHKSKYVLSNTRDTYHEAKKLLDKGKAVLYSGTPCQIAGLKSYLAKDYHHLLCVDIFCHGAGSNSQFKQYINEESKDISVTQYSFRYKKDTSAKNVKLVFDNDKEVIRTRDEDLYMSGYAEALFYRQSCLECRYACEEREGDVSIGDGWKIRSLYPELNPDVGVSIILFNNKKSEALIEYLNTSMKIYDVPYDFVVKTVDTMTKPTYIHRNRRKFFRLVDRGYTLHKAINCCLERNRLLRKLANKVLPERLKKFIRCCRKKLRR